MSAVVETKNLTKRYREKLAVNALNLTVQEGEVFGFLGPNGAGKTTTISHAPRLDRADLRTRSPFAASIQRTNHWKSNGASATCRKSRLLRRHQRPRKSSLHGAAQSHSGRRSAPSHFAEVLDQVGLADDSRRLVKEFSRGMKQRLGIAEVLVKKPKAIILDEPTLGIDPDGAIRILELIKNLNREHGLTVMLSSHPLQQVQAHLQPGGHHRQRQADRARTDGCPRQSDLERSRMELSARSQAATPTA